MEENTTPPEPNEDIGITSAPTPLADLALSNRTLNALLNYGIKTVQGVIRKSEQDLRWVDGLGPKGIIEIKSQLARMGLKLKDAASETVLPRIWRFCPHCGNKLS
jgi:DNA-directed RNA polymerase alpha subunit